MLAPFEFHDVEDLVACFAKIIENPDKGIADVTFNVGERRFGGLRKVLASRCPVFDSMFNKGFKEGCSTEEVCLPQFDHAAVAFQVFLLYMHSGHASLNELPLDLHEIAKYFGMDGLRKQCEEAIRQTSPSIQNSLEILRFAELNNLLSIGECCSSFIFEHAEDVFAEPSSVVAKTPQSFLRLLFQSDRVNISETLLFQIVLAVPENVQQELLSFVRLPVMPTADILNIVLPSNLVNKDVVIKALAFQADPKSVELSDGRATKKRKFAQLCGCDNGKCGILALPIWKTSALGSTALQSVVRICKHALVKRLKETCCLELGLNFAKVKIFDYFNEKKYADLDNCLEKTLDNCRIFGNNAILLIELP